MTAVALLTVFLLADPYPPYWTDSEGNRGPAVHFLPVPWPDEADWIPYTAQGSSIEDPRTQDPSNGGTAPQNYVNVSSCIPDKSAPSVFWYFDPGVADPGDETVFYRFTVEQIPNTYATGPKAGTYSATDPWNSAQWNILIDTNGDGYRDFAVLLNGSSGSPSTAIDRLVSIWSPTRSQSLDYVGNPDVHLLFHNPTAFVDRTTHRILNFQSQNLPVADWPNGSAETVWDYGATRSIAQFGNGCEQYVIDIQIPLGMLDASAVGGPVVTERTPLALMFATANSLTNPMQKDAVLKGDTYFVADPSKPAPFGDVVTMEGGGSEPEPSIVSLAASGCGSVLLTADVIDSTKLDGTKVVTTVDWVTFYFYRDTDGNGIADDGNSWALAATAATSDNPVGRWTATWNTSSLGRGYYLIGAVAADEDTGAVGDQPNLTYSYLTEAQVPPLGAPAGYDYYANPTPEPGLVIANLFNSCGAAPSVTKSASPTTVGAGGDVVFTVTLNNPTAADLSLTAVEDRLPEGFSYVGPTSGTLGVDFAPSQSGQTLTWNTTATVPAGTSRTLVFTAAASSISGTYSNVVTVAGSTSAEGALTLESLPAQVSVGAARLTLSKSASPGSLNPGDTVTFTITYSNDSAVNATGVTITDTVADGVEFVSASNGGTHAGGTITWTIGDLPSGDGPYSVSFTGTVADPYPDSASVPYVNQATIDSVETDPVTARSSTYVAVPRASLAVQKDAGSIQVSAGGQVTFTISYANTGNVGATGVVLTDPVPAGFSFVSASDGGSLAGGAVTWNIGSLDAGASGSRTLTLVAADPYSEANPQTNTATISATGIDPVSDEFQLGVTSSACSTSEVYYFLNSSASEVPFGDLPTPPTASSYTYFAREVTAPAGTATTATTNLASNGVPYELARFYTDPVAGSGTSFTGNLVVNAYLNKTSGNPVTFTTKIYSVTPSTGAVTAMGDASTATGNGGLTNALTTFTVTPTAPLNQGDRLLVRIEATLASGSNRSVGVLFDGATSPSSLTYCPVPIRMAMDKLVNRQVAEPGEEIEYSIKYGNLGLAAVTGTTLVDTLPAGVTFVSATLNGNPRDPDLVEDNTYTFSIGEVAAGVSGTLIIRAAVDSPLTSGVTLLENQVSLTSKQTLTMTDSAATGILRPDVTVTKSASPTLVNPGEPVTYTVTVTNNGQASATGVTIEDSLPVETYFTYVDNSAELNGSSISPDPVSGSQLSYTVGSLAGGASATVSYQMLAGADGLGDSLVGIDNTASVSDDQTAGSRESDPVTVTISTNPNLILEKVMTPAATLSTGDEITITLTLTNTGSGTATGVQISDPIPSRTAYVSGSGGSFDAANNRVLFSIGDLIADGQVIRSFKVQVVGPLSAGSTTISNTATASSGNTSSKTASDQLSASASTNLQVSITGPITEQLPSSYLAVDATATTEVTVTDAAFLKIGQYVKIGGTVAQITSIAGNQLTLDTAVTANEGDEVVPGLLYTLTYSNAGDASAASCELTYCIPVGLEFHEAADGGVYSATFGPDLRKVAGQSELGRISMQTCESSVSWSVGLLNPGDSGYTTVLVFPTQTGTYDNPADLTSSDAEPVSDLHQTEVGAPVVFKSTSTAQVEGGERVTYVIEVQNGLSTEVTGVQVKDLLPNGFRFHSTVEIRFDGTPTTASISPAFGDIEPLWGTFTIPGNTSLFIEFQATTPATAGGQIYQNEVVVTADQSVSQFDAFATTAEDVTLNASPSAVTLSAFHLQRDGRSVSLSWETSPGAQVRGFLVWRSVEPRSPGKRMGPMIPSESLGAMVPHRYSYVDRGAPTGRDLYYRIQFFDEAGRAAWSEPLIVVVPEM